MPAMTRRRPRAPAATATYPRRARRADPEGDLQKRIVAELRRADVDFCHVPNSAGRGGAGGKRQQAKLKALGVEAGVSDLIIFSRPAPDWTRGGWISVGACIELKATDRVTAVPPWEDKRATVEQRSFLRRRHEQGWAVAVCGPTEAIAQLRAWGYLPATPFVPTVERNLSTPEGRAFWAPTPGAPDVDTWPDWMRAGINVDDAHPDASRTARKKAPR